MTFSRGDRTELVINMTLAEIFLLLLFVVWYGVAPNNKGHASDTTPPEVQIRILKAENSKLKAENQKLHDELEDFDRRLQWWRSHFPDLKIPGSERELEALRTELGRGKPACQPGNNLIADVMVEEGHVTLRLRTLAPSLEQSMGLQGPSNLRPGMLLSKESEIGRFINGIKNYRRTIEGEPRECRFDYRLIWTTYKDYYEGREQFEKYFYASVRSRSSSAYH